MIIYKEILPLQYNLQELKNNDKKIGFVPTMGALHNGHLSLIVKSKQTNDITVCSIFVNPTQFNDKKDFEKYPVTIENDIYLLEKAKTDVLFIPAVKEIYPEGLNPAPLYVLGYMETILEGQYRPGHFQGVCRVMHKLINIIQPHDLFMGQKDYQQCLVIKKLIDTYNISTHLHIVPTQREESGLALSSRNLRLSANGKQNATAIYSALNYIKNNLSGASLQHLKEEAISMLSCCGFEKIDYVEICDSNTLTLLTEYTNKTKMVALAAAFIEGVRLIDNLILNQAFNNLSDVS
jgi:pantoate--beta-alanine ligase